VRIGLQDIPGSPSSAICLWAISKACSLVLPPRGLARKSWKVSFTLSTGFKHTHRTLRNVGYTPSAAFSFARRERGNIHLLTIGAVIDFLHQPHGARWRRRAPSEAWFSTAASPAIRRPHSLGPEDRPRLTAFTTFWVPCRFEHIKGLQIFCPEYRLVHGCLTMPPPVGWRSGIKVFADTHREPV